MKWFAHRSSRLLVLLGLVAFVWVRRLMPLVGVGNPDIAGILYSADRINEGLLPYRDTLDMKPPGSFFIVAFVFRMVRDLNTLRVVFDFWILLGAPAIAVAMRALSDLSPREMSKDQTGWSVSLAVTLYLLTACAFDMNYTSWMVPAYTWAFALLLSGLARNSSVAHLFGGVSATFAYLLKTQAVVIAPLFLLVWVWSRRRGDRGATFYAWIFWVAGALAGLAPLVVFYGSKGALNYLMSGIFPVSNALAYTESRGLAGNDLRILWLVPFEQGRAFPLQIALSVAALMGARALSTNYRVFDSSRSASSPEPSLMASPSAPQPVAPQLLFYGASIVGCGLGGMRFYLHYLMQCLPPLALLGAHPAGLRWLAGQLSPREQLQITKMSSRKLAWLFSRAHLLVVLGIGAWVVGRIPFGRGELIENHGSKATVEAGLFIRKNTDPREKLLVWGWGGWGTYYFANRRSPSRVFKVIGQLTDFNDNSAFASATSMHFRDGPVARAFLDDMRADPPTFIVRSVPFFPGSPSDPLEEFTALRDIVNRDYFEVARFDSLHVYELRARIR